MFSTVVHVRERQQEYKIEVLDRSFDPPIVVIEEGDRIWWHWDRQKVAFYSKVQFSVLVNISNNATFFTICLFFSQPDSQYHLFFSTSERVTSINYLTVPTCL